MSGLNKTRTVFTEFPTHTVSLEFSDNYSQKIAIMFATLLKKICSKLTFLAPITYEKKKLTSIFIFTLLSGVSKGCTKALKAFIKPSNTTQTQYFKMHGARRVKKKTLEQSSRALPWDLF